jgi:hypothetical protein
MNNKELDIINEFINNHKNNKIFSNIDNSKIQYNAIYHTEEYWANKWPPKSRNELIVNTLYKYYAQKSKENNISPLNEYEQLNKQFNK